MYKLPEGEYTICIEFIPVTMNNVSVDVLSTSLNIHKQSKKSFSYYTRTIINMHKWHISLPEYIMVDLKCDGQPTLPNTRSSISNNLWCERHHVYDSPFIFENN